MAFGESEMSAALSSYSFEDHDDSETLPFVEAQMRHGFGERWDAGFKTGSNAMLQADLNYALVLRDDFALSIDPTVAVLPIADTLISYVWLPVLVDVVSTERVTVTLSARWGYASVDSVGDDDLGIDESMPLFGAGVGLRWQVNDTLALMPEFQLLYPAEHGLSDERFYAITLGFIF